MPYPEGAQPYKPATPFLPCCDNCTVDKLVAAMKSTRDDEGRIECQACGRTFQYERAIELPQGDETCESSE